MTSHYVGRFAPSPTGPLHLGSLVAALASFLDARAAAGKWLLRIEDIDPPREQQGASDAILRCLEAHHLLWDDDILYQSTRHEAYRQALSVLTDRQLSYRCTCSRQDRQPTDTIYNGHCRHLQHGSGVPAAIRLNIEAALRSLDTQPVMNFNDLIQGWQQQNALTDIGDFIIHRKDGLFAYQLAVVVDDAYQRITHVIRGADLLDSTAPQILLFRLLGAPAPSYGHLPLVTNTAGEKLSKQNLAPAIDNQKTSLNLWTALQSLHQNPPVTLKNAPPQEILAWALPQWKNRKIT